MTDLDNSDVEHILTAALIRYRDTYAETLRSTPDHAVIHAKELVSRARTIAKSGGLSTALTRVLLNEVKHWPAWSNRPDFWSHVNFDADDILAQQLVNSDGNAETLVGFKYKFKRYKLVFIDEGWSNYGDAFHSGRVEFHSDDALMFGLQIFEEFEFDYSRWSEFDLYALRIGEWTKALIEIAADIEANRHASLEQLRNADVVRKARNIEL